MTNWQRHPIDLAYDGKTEVEARETTAGDLVWRGLDGTAFETWQGGGPRTNQTIAEQIQDTAFDRYENTKMQWDRPRQ